MGAQISRFLGLKQPRSASVGPKWVSENIVRWERGLFTKPSGQNILDPVPDGENQYVTVFFEWRDNLLSDLELMDLVVDRISAADGIIGPEAIHHDTMWCLSIRVPRHYNASDLTIAAIAQDIAKWHKSEKFRAGKKLDRNFLFRRDHWMPLKFPLISYCT
jgi:hypothetical protein